MRRGRTKPNWVAKPVKVTCPKHGEYEDFPEILSGCPECEEEREQAREEAEEVRKVMLDAIDEFQGGRMTTAEKVMDHNFTVECIKCERGFEVFMNYDDYQDWISGRKLIQVAMPYMSPEMRELLISRRCPICMGSKQIADFITPFEAIKQAEALDDKHLDDKCGCGRYRRDCTHPLPRTLTTRQGVSFETYFTDAQAAAKLVDLVFGTKEIKSEFAIDLAILARDKKKISDGRMVWVHKLVLENLHPQQKKGPAMRLQNMDRIIKMFEEAKQHLKRPKIRLEINGQGVILSQAGSQSKWPGSIVVKKMDAGNDYLGRIAIDGAWFPAKKTLTGIEDLLRMFAEDPEGVAAAYGKLTGHCCFCNLPLSDERSTEVGYGPVCAKNWGLKWGN